MNKREQLAAVLAGLVFASASHAIVWKSRTMDDAIDGQMEYVYAQLPKSTMYGQNVGTTGAIGARCKNGQLEVLIASKIPFVGFRPYVEYRIDDDEAEKGVWRIGKGMVLYYGDDRRLFRKMMRGTTLVLRMSRMKLGTEVLKVSLMGFTKASREVREKCTLS